MHLTNMISFKSDYKKSYIRSVYPERSVCNNTYNKVTCYCQDSNSEVKSTLCSQKRCKLQINV